MPCVIACPANTLMERETKIIKTPISGEEVKLYTYLTGGENKQLQGVYLSAAKFEISEEGGFKTKDYDTNTIQLAEDKLIELMVISINGDNKDILKRINNMRLEDYKFVIEAIKEITDSKKKQ